MAGLNEYKPISSDNLHKDLNAAYDEVLHRKLIKNSITVVKNEEEVLPIKILRIRELRMFL